MMVSHRQKKGITPIIATIVLMFITIALIGLAYPMFTAIVSLEKCIEKAPLLPPECKDGRIKVYVHNCGQKDLTAEDFSEITVNGADIISDSSITSQTIQASKSSKIINDYDCGCGCYETQEITLIAEGNIVRNTVDCGSPPTEICDDNIDQDCDGKVGTSDQDNDCICKPEFCSCDEAVQDFVEWNCNGDTIYVDCHTDTCWTPYLTNKQWSSGTTDACNLFQEDYVSPCEVGDFPCVCDENDPDCSACNYCKTLIWAGLNKWKLPTRSETQSLVSNNFCSAVDPYSCFNEPLANFAEWTSEGDSTDSAFFYHKPANTIANSIKLNNYGVRCLLR